MRTSDFGVKGIADQRYYHFVLLRGDREFNLPSFWRRIGTVVDPAVSAASKGRGWALHHRKLRSDRSFSRAADVAMQVSERGQGAAPFLYDVFALTMNQRGTSLVMVGFPFASLALQVVSEVVSRGLVGATRDFLSVDVPKLVKLMESVPDQSDESLSLSVVGLQCVVVDDKTLAAVRLGGDAPLRAEIYTKFLKKKIDDGSVRPDNCVLRCDSGWPADEPDYSAESIRSRLRVDEYGNFRPYAQLGCTNLRILPAVIFRLKELGCLKRAVGNPLLRLEDQE